MRSWNSLKSKIGLAKFQASNELWATGCHRVSSHQLPGAKHGLCWPRNGYSNHQHFRWVREEMLFESIRDWYLGTAGCISHCKWPAQCAAGISWPNAAASLMVPTVPKISKKSKCMATIHTAKDGLEQGIPVFGIPLKGFTPILQILKTLTGSGGWTHTI